MADFLLDTATGDLDLSTNDIQIVTGKEEIRQHIKIRLLFFFAEWFLDTRLGVKYFEQILRKRPLLATVQVILRAAIKSTPGVIDLLSFTFDLDSVTRTLSVDFRASIVGDDVLDFSEELII